MAINPNITLGGNQLHDVASGGGIGVGDGTNAPNNADVKSYVDAVAQGLKTKGPATAVVLANVASLTGLAAVGDGVTLGTDGMIALLTAQSTGSQNGAWVVHAGAWTRPANFAAGSSAAGAFWIVEQGTLYHDTGWVCSTDPPSDVVDTNSLALSMFFSATALSNADGTLVFTGTDVRRAAITGDVGIPAGSNVGTIANAAVTATKLANTTVTAGAYGDASHVVPFTVDAQGRLTEASAVAIAISAGAVSGLAAIATSGSASDLVAGTVPAARMPGFTGGEVTSSPGSLVLTIGASTVTLAKMANLAAQRLLGNDTGTGAPVPLTVGPGAHFSGGFNELDFDYITGVTVDASWRGSTVSGKSLTIDASFGTDGGPLLMRASRWSFDVVSPIGHLTASTEQVAWDHHDRLVTWSTGALATQRETVFRAPTYAFVAASTITTAATVSITAAPFAGTNATITTPLALLVESGNASVLGGRLGVGTASPSYPLEVLGMTRHSGATGINANPDAEAFAYLQTQITGDRDRVHFRVGGAGTALPTTGSIVSYSDWDTSSTTLATSSTIAGLFTHRIRPQTFFSTAATITDNAPATVVIDGPPNFIGGMTVPSNPRALRVKDGDVAVDLGNLQVTTGNVNILTGQLNTRAILSQAGGVTVQEGEFSVAVSGIGSAFRAKVTTAGAVIQAGFFGTLASQQTFGAATAGATYTGTEQTMLQRLWDMARTFGFNT